MIRTLKSRTKKISWVLFLFFTGLGATSQVLLKGSVKNEQNEPIPFVNIGIRGSYVGTISEVNGTFELLVPADRISKKIFFSCVGYLPISIPISTIRREVHVVLEEDVARLNDVVISEKRIKPKIEKVGKPYSVEGRFMVDTTYSGSAIAQLVESPFDTTFIHWITLGYVNDIDGLQMRIKIREVDDKGYPGKLLINKEIVVDLNTFDGYDRFDLEDHFLYTTQNKFFIELEPLVLKENRKQVHRIITEARKNTPHLIRYNDYGEIILDNEELDLRYIQFKVSGERSEKTLYRTSSFGKWYKSEELALQVGLSEGSLSNDEELSDSRILGLFKRKSKDVSSLGAYENDDKIRFTSLADYLRRVGGLTVQGKGSDILVLVRGLGSMSFQLSNEPIFVVDGLNIGRGYSSVNNSVDVNQIQSIRVLGSLAETAIYGEEGKNGVVIIKTKGNN